PRDLSLNMPRVPRPSSTCMTLVRLVTRGCALLALLGISRHATADELAADGRVHVTYWEKWTGFEGDAMRQVVERFNRSQDRIVVDYFTISSINRKTLIATAGGDPPDVAGIWAQTVPQFADAAALTPLDDYIARDGQNVDDWLSRYEPVFAAICTHAGRVYAGISSPATVALSWNKTVSRAAGL